MLMPKREKRRKQFRGRMTGRAIRGSQVVYGDYGLQATEPCWMTSYQLEAARVAINRYMKRGGKVWIKVFPDKTAVFSVFCNCLIAQDFLIFIYCVKIKDKYTLWIQIIIY